MSAQTTPEIERLPTAALVPYARNARTHDESQVSQIAKSIQEFGFTNPVLIDADNGIIAGHGRVMAANTLGLEQVPCLRLGYLTEAQKRAYIIADNRIALNAGWDEEMLRLELHELQDLDFDLELLGFNDDELLSFMDDTPPGDQGREQYGNIGGLADRFMIPPFSVVSARDGWWQDRKKQWIALGLQSELGRGDVQSSLKSAYKVKMMSQNPNLIKEDIIVPTWAVSSIFDPVVCEIAYRWFSPVGGQVLDPFAGGSVRGVIASKLGRRYIGVDLSAAQIAANREQAEALCAGEQHKPVWHISDSREIETAAEGVEADFIFSCPPYADLERYSDDPQDISTLSYAEFKAAYFDIIRKTCRLLKPDRFACFVVSEVRDKSGHYYDFVSDTVKAFKAAGLRYYNEIILVTQTGTLAIRAGKQFTSGRKIGKCHQNILVFVKGDSKKAVEGCGFVDVTDSLAVIEPDFEYEGSEDEGGNDEYGEIL